ncbi:hypothetical protein [Nguyenibacter sp. L1]|uniref:hypothetical protein n=1 Tax=Nguyenibacter sp. L1 TaxID=3049350 RepID=UPI002B4A03B1|nr:hypothetical protein [Nguyenibacter sp. L1]WRH88646.1 hypothetical protein QN315_03205 [Nguyenibacter sp. L1]
MTGAPTGIGRRHALWGAILLAALGAPPARAQFGCGANPGACPPNPAAREQLRMQLQTEIQQRQFAARQRAQEAIDRDRARLTILQQQHQAAPPGPSMPQTPEEQWLNADIARQDQAMRGTYHAQPTGPGTWTIRNGQGTPQGACRAVGTALIC